MLDQKEMQKYLRKLQHWQAMSEQDAAHWRDPATQEHGVNSFDGEWQISDHSRIPQLVMNFLLEKFPKAVRIKQIPLEDVNAALNEIWQGPGSMAIVVEHTEQLRAARCSIE